jgi:hypothetical protein
MNTHHLIPRMVCAPFNWVNDYVKSARNSKKIKQQYLSKGEVNEAAAA